MPVLNSSPAHDLTRRLCVASTTFTRYRAIAATGPHPDSAPPHSDVDSVSQALTGTISNAFDPPATDALAPTVVPEPLSAVLLGTALPRPRHRLSATPRQSPSERTRARRPQYF